jgi:hypothetical protein
MAGFPDMELSMDGIEGDKASVAHGWFAGTNTGPRAQAVQRLRGVDSERERLIARSLATSTPTNNARWRT